MTSWSFTRERGLWFAAVATLGVTVGWLQLLNLILLWNVMDDRFPHALAVARALGRAAVLVARSGLPAILVGIAIVVTMIAVLAGSLRSGREEVQHG